MSLRKLPRVKYNLLLVNTPVELDGEIIPVSGIFSIEEYHPYEPSAYVWSPYLSLASLCHDEPLGDSGWYSVDMSEVESDV